MIKLFIDNREIKDLVIIKYTPAYEILDSEASGRTKAPGWEMYRDPQGVICNFAIEIWEGTRVDNADLIYFMTKAVSLGKQQFVQVCHVDPIMQEWNQEMFCKVDPYDIYLKNPRDTVAYAGTIKARFVAKKGRV